MHGHGQFSRREEGREEGEGKGRERKEEKVGKGAVF